MSFISVTLLIPALVPFLRAGGDWIILVKPQFEVGREFVGKGGIVRDPAAHRFACDKVAASLQQLNFTVSLTDSPILGAEGNREFLLHARRRTRPEWCDRVGLGKLSFNSTGKMREIATVGIISKPKIARAVEIVCGLAAMAAKRTVFDTDAMSRLHNMHRCNESYPRQDLPDGY